MSHSLTIEIYNQKVSLLKKQSEYLYVAKTEKKHPEHFNSINYIIFCFVVNQKLVVLDEKEFCMCS